ncbi:MAG: calcium/sodium antiporter [Pseudomonadales bacterium]|nr:calcium/sodium antiporter [Pseudomonadales bacterium]
MLLDLVIISLGFVGLTWGADKFVFGASTVASNLRVPPMVIGLTIVAFGTSAPEIFSSLVAALEDKPDLAIGNAIGSNIFNLGLALGIAAMIKPLTPAASLMRKELPALLAVTVITGLLLLDGHLGIIDSMVFIAILVFFAYTLVKKKASGRTVSLDLSVDEEEIASISVWRASIYLILGLLLLIISAEALVRAASSIAETLGVSAGIIGLTIVALGTSLPELATTITCTLRAHHDLAIGNIVGSNLLNILIVLPIPGLLAPDFIDSSLLSRDYVTMLLMTIILAGISYTAICRGKQIGRLSGALFVLMYVGWFGVLYSQL